MKDIPRVGSDFSREATPPIGVPSEVTDAPRHIEKMGSAQTIFQDATIVGAALGAIVIQGAPEIGRFWRKHKPKHAAEGKGEPATDQPAVPPGEEELPPPGKLSPKQRRRLDVFSDDVLRERYGESTREQAEEIRRELEGEPQIEEIKQELGIGDVRPGIYERLEALRQKENLTKEEAEKMRELREQLRGLDRPEDTND